MMFASTMILIICVAGFTASAVSEEGWGCAGWAMAGAMTLGFIFK